MRFALSFFILLMISPAHADAALSGVVINEIMYDLEGADDPHEWVEIANIGSSDINLEGWKFSDGKNHLLVMPPEKGGQGGMVLAPDSYAILADNAAQFTKDHPGFSGTVIDTVLSLNNTNDTLSLLDTNGIEVTTVSYSNSIGAAGNGRTLERGENGSLHESGATGGSPGQENSTDTPPAPSPPPAVTPSPSEDNLATPNAPSASATDEVETDSTLSEEDIDVPLSKRAPISEPYEDSDTSNSEKGNGLIISEVLPNPEGKDAESEFIELFNGGAFEITLDGWSIRDASGKQLTLSGTISPNEYLPIFSRDTSLPSLNNSGDVIELLTPNSIRRDGISYGKAKEGVSLGRDTDGVWRWTTLPTPGSENRILAASAPQNASSLAVAPSAPENNTPPNTKPLDINVVTGSSLGNSQLSAGLGLVGPNNEKPRGDWSLFFGFLFSLAAGFAMFILRVLRKQPEPSVEFAVEETENTNP